MTLLAYDTATFFFLWFLPLDSAAVFKTAKNFSKFFDEYKTFNLNFSSPVKHKLMKRWASKESSFYVLKCDKTKSFRIY